MFFDFGNTLVYASSSPVEIWLELAREIGFQAEEGAVKHALQEADVFFTRKIYDYKGRMREFWALYDGLVLDKLGISDPDGRIARAIEQGFDQPKWFHLYPESRNVLEALKRHGHRLGIISGNTEDVLKQMDWLDMTRYFDSVTYSQEAGANKPDPAIFHVALKRARSPPNEAVYVGNDYEQDVLGARAARITPILVDREGRYPDVDCWRVKDLREIERLLQ